MPPRSMVKGILRTDFTKTFKYCAVINRGAIFNHLACFSIVY